MSASLQWDGLEAFRQALHQLPDDLTDEGGAIVLAHADVAERTIAQHYPQGPTGNLRQGVTLTQSRSRFGASARVVSRAKHASMFERGTSPRQTRRGANRGQMPVASESQRMIPAVIRVRTRMRMALIDLLRRAGFVVHE
jgi:hypothetical protein